MHLKRYLIPTFAAVGSLTACHGTPAAEGPSSASDAQQVGTSVRPFAIAKCVSSEAEIGADRKTITLTAQMVDNVLMDLTGTYFQGSEHESSEAGLEGSIAMIAKNSAGEYQITLKSGLFFFGDDSEGGERTVLTKLITLDTAEGRVNTGSSLGSIGACTFSNLSLLDSFVHRD